MTVAVVLITGGGLWAGDLGSPIIVLHRGDKGFDEMVKLIPGMTPAKTVDINLALKTKEN